MQNTNIQPDSDLNKKVIEIQNNVNKLSEVLKTLSIKQKELSEVLQKTTKDFDTNAKSIDKNKESIEKLNEHISQAAKVVKESSNSLTYNKELLSNLLTKYQDLTTTHANNSTAVRNLKLQIVDLSIAIDNQEKDLAKSTSSFDFQKKIIHELTSSFDKIKDKATEMGPEFASTLESASKGFNAMKDGLSVVKTGFQSVGGAIKTSGFGLLVLVLESIVEYFTKTKDGAELLRQFLGGLGVVIDTIKGGLSKFKIALGEVFVHPFKGLKKLGKLIDENILNRLKAFSIIYEGLVNKDFKKVANGFLQMTTGVKDVYTKAQEAFAKQSDKALAQKAKQEKELAEKKKQKEKEAEKERIRKEKEAEKRAIAAKNRQQKLQADREANIANSKRIKEEKKKLNQEAHDELLASQARMAESLLKDYAKEIYDTQNHFKTLIKKYKDNRVTLEQLKKEEAAALGAIQKKFQEEEAKKLDEYHKDILQMALQYQVNVKEMSLTALENETKEKLAKLDIEEKAVLKKNKEQQDLAYKLLGQGKFDEAALAQKAADEERKQLEITGKLKQAILKEQKTKEAEINQQESIDKETKKESGLEKEISTAREGGHESAALKKEIELLKTQHDFAVQAATSRNEATTKIDADYAKKKADLENKLVASKIHAGDKYIDAVLKNTKKDSAIYKAAFLAKKATAIADVIMSSKQAIIESFKGYAGMPFIGQALAIAQGAFIAGQAAMSIADIAKQKPGMATGGVFVSDGRGAVLPGYSRTDNTNAYLRSGEAVVVSEAMRNPWARNLVSAINVAHGGRDFSIPNTGRGYAIGGIFTDGGNASRYYSQPLNDQKDLANTLAYQLINNFPPIYVDVKDVNNQQSILAQTVDRVNL
ncbi:hypothetical protein ABDD95_15585 [Mucilaginibacter sp. PAMB04274]|uniref:hypothetical protein n=1 Tax=Mucilaginibacter sp. PAMB04274 TaxID=3138568 RepID=UPI0031F6D50B